MTRYIDKVNKKMGMVSGGVNTGGDDTISVVCGCMYLKKVKNRGSGAVVRVRRSLCEFQTGL